MRSRTPGATMRARSSASISSRAIVSWKRTRSWRKPSSRRPSSNSSTRRSRSGVICVPYGNRDDRHASCGLSHVGSASSRDSSRISAWSGRRRPSACARRAREPRRCRDARRRDRRCSCRARSAHRRAGARSASRRPSARSCTVRSDVSGCRRSRGPRARASRRRDGGRRGRAAAASSTRRLDLRARHRRRHRGHRVAALAECIDRDLEQERRVDAARERDDDLAVAGQRVA